MGLKEASHLFWAALELWLYIVTHVSADGVSSLGGQPFLVHHLCPHRLPGLLVQLVYRTASRQYLSQKDSRPVYISIQCD